MPQFSYFPTPDFAARLAKIEKHDPPGHTRILDVIDRILENPGDADGWMHGEHHGRLKKYVGRRDYCPDGVSRWFYERATGSYSTLLAREGTTPAKLKKLKDSMPAARRMTKTDLAKYINAWAQKPHLVSLGSQKNFIDLMKELENDKTTDEIDPGYYKRLIAKAIIFRTVQKLVRPMFQAFQANVAAYLVSILSFKIGNRVDLSRIWQQQELSQDLKLQLTTWAVEVNSVLHKSANGRMVSEWAKKPDCWTAVQDAAYSTVKGSIPEIV